MNGILCAVNFDDRTRSLVRTGAHLAKRVGVPLALVHVAEPWDQFGITQFLSQDKRASELVRNADAETFQRAEGLLVSLVEELVPPEIAVTTRVLTGNAGEILVAEAHRTGHWVMTGVKKTYSTFYPKNISTTLTLASECPTPVLFLPEGGGKKLEGSLIRILASDDLKSESKTPPILVACQLARCYEGGDIWHAHVSGMNEETLNTSIAAAFAEARSPLEPSLAGKELFQLMTEAMQRQLIQRASQDTACPALVHSVLRFGDIEDELQALCREENLNVAVFGRHHPFHKAPFYLGNMPTAAMFKIDLPVIIAPS